MSWSVFKWADSFVPLPTVFDIRALTKRLISNAFGLQYLNAYRLLPPGNRRNVPWILTSVSAIHGFNPFSLRDVSKTFAAVDEIRPYLLFQVVG